MFLLSEAPQTRFYPAVAAGSITYSGEGEVLGVRTLKGVDEGEVIGPEGIEMFAVGGGGFHRVVEKVANDEKVFLAGIEGDFGGDDGAIGLEDVQKAVFVNYVGKGGAVLEFGYHEPGGVEVIGPGEGADLDEAVHLLELEEAVGRVRHKPAFVVFLPVGGLAGKEAGGEGETQRLESGVRLSDFAFRSSLEAIS